MSLLSKYHIRCGELRDCAEIAQMIDSSAEGAVDYLYQNLKHEKTAIDILAEQLASEVHYSYANTLVAECERSVVAMALSFPSNGLQLDTNMLSNFSSSKQRYLHYFIDNRLTDSWHLDALYVAGPQRNIGIGHQLLARVKKQASGYGFPTLQVFVYSTNTGAIRFYQRNNFTVDKSIYVEEHEFLKHKQGLLRMSCVLDE